MHKLLVCLATLLALQALAHADNPAEARIHYDRGLAAYALENFADAAVEYEKAFALKPDPRILYNAAQAHRGAGNYERALHLYQSYLRVYGKRAEKREDVERLILELQAAVATQKKAQASPPVGVAEPDTTSPQTKPSIVEPAPTLSTPPETVTNALIVDTAPSAPKRVYKKGWFWGVVVGAVVVVGVGVGLGVGLSSSGGNSPVNSIGMVTVH